MSVGVRNLAQRYGVIASGDLRSVAISLTRLLRRLTSPRNDKSLSLDFSPRFTRGRNDSEVKCVCYEQ